MLPQKTGLLLLLTTCLQVRLVTTEWALVVLLGLVSLNVKVQQVQHSISTHTHTHKRTNCKQVTKQMSDGHLAYILICWADSHQPRPDCVTCAKVNLHTHAKTSLCSKFAQPCVPLIHHYTHLLTTEAPHLRGAQQCPNQ